MIKPFTQEFSGVTLTSHYSLSLSLFVSVLYVCIIWKTRSAPHSSPEMDSFQTASEADSKSKSVSLGRGESGAKRSSRPSS